MSGGCGVGGSTIFDTDVLTWFLRGDGGAARLIEAQSATAREAALTLATGNARHFKAIPGLELKVFRPGVS